TQTRDVQISGAMDNHRRRVGDDRAIALADRVLAVSVREEDGRTIVDVDGGRIVSVASDWLPGRGHAGFDLDGSVVGVKVARSGSGWRLRWRGIDMVVHVRSPRTAELARLMPKKLPPDLSRSLLCPMPGVITSIAVSAGDTVEAGQVLATVEAMKMENVLRAERRATVRLIAAKAGASLAVDELIMEFE
ncbi:biotin/lipoyl-containing protein, partial [Rhizobiaceae sp. 2RAB30]